MTPDLLAEAAAFASLLQAWRVLEKRLPAAARRAFAWRLEDRLLDIGDSLAAGTYAPHAAPHAAPAGFHSTGSGKRVPAPRLKDRLVPPALKQTLQPCAERFFTCDTYAGLPGRGRRRCHAAANGPEPCHVDCSANRIPVVHCV